LNLPSKAETKKRINIKYIAKFMPYLDIGAL